MPNTPQDTNLNLRQVSLHHAMHLSDIQASHSEEPVTHETTLEIAREFYKFLTDTTEMGIKHGPQAST